jgi:hypothetical protein
MNSYFAVIVVTPGIDNSSCQPLMTGNVPGQDGLDPGVGAATKLVTQRIAPRADRIRLMLMKRTGALWRREPGTAAGLGP